MVILLKIVALGDKDWYNKDVASQLGISNSEVSESLNRSLVGGLIKKDKKSIRKESLLEFLVYGIKYVFPAISGKLIRGMPSAQGHSTKGIAIEPLYKTVPEACAKDPKLYDLLALIDALRIGERNEQVVELLAKKIYNVE